MKANGMTERIVEVPWLVSKLGTPKRILDIGSTDAWYLESLKATGAKVTAIDTRPFDAPDGVTAIVGDAEKLPVMVTYDLITCVSVLDHVGLRAYGNIADDGKLLRVVAEIHRALDPGGRLLLTVPVGRDCVTTHPGGGQRVFSEDALLGLFDARAWEWKDAQLWALVDDCYIETDWPTVHDAEYAATRAGAVVGLELVKK